MVAKIHLWWSAPLSSFFSTSKIYTSRFHWCHFFQNWLIHGFLSLSYLLRQPWLFGLYIFLSTISLIWMLSFGGILSQEIFLFGVSFCFGLFLVSSNVNPRLCLLIVSVLFTFSCLESIFMVIEHFFWKFLNETMWWDLGGVSYILWWELGGDSCILLIFLGCWYGNLVTCGYLIFGYLTFC